MRIAVNKLDKERSLVNMLEVYEGEERVEKRIERI